jgi:sugar O-acyltransferase (sialic acid O-acetyltransferase NeuD family)
MAERLVLVGAGGLTAEVISLLRGVSDSREIVLLDDRHELVGTSVLSAPVLGGIDTIVDHPTSDILLCVGHGVKRQSIAARLTSLGVTEERYSTVRHHSVEIPVGCVVGRGSILLAGVVMTASVTVGRHVVAMPHATMTHGNTVGDFATLCAGASLGGFVTVGRAAYLGMNACVRQNVTVGAGTTLGMGAVLLADLPDGQTWAGVPARPLGRWAT